MENSWNPNLYGIGGEDEDYRRLGARFVPHHRSISEQNHLANNATAVESDYMRRQQSAGNMDSGHQLLSSGVPHYSISAGAGTGAGPMWNQFQHADRSSSNSHSRTAGETELMRQQYADSNPRRKSPAFTEERKPRKREANRAQMEIGKEELEALQGEIEHLRLENKSLRQENARQKKQIDDLKKYEEQHEALEAENRRLKDKYIELLEKSNPLVDPRFELGQQHVQPTSFSRASACGSVTGHHASPY